MFSHKEQLIVRIMILDLNELLFLGCIVFSINSNCGMVMEITTVSIIILSTSSVIIITSFLSFRSIQCGSDHPKNPSGPGTPSPT
jgi:hypothetical protein